MVNVTIPNATQPIVDIIDGGRGQKIIAMTKPWRRFFSQLHIRTGQDTDLVASGVNVGDLKATAKSTAPTGWLICDGSAVSRTTYATLFTAISTTYGVGDNSTTFNLPDGVGRVLIGAGTGTATAATAHARGDESGDETHTLTTQELATHAHAVANGTGVVNSAAGSEYVTTAGNKGNAVNVTTANSGSGQAHTIMQPFFVANWIIKT